MTIKNKNLSRVYWLKQTNIYLVGDKSCDNLLWAKNFPYCKDKDHYPTQDSNHAK